MRKASSTCTPLSRKETRTQKRKKNPICTVRDQRFFSPWIPQKKGSLELKASTQAGDISHISIVTEFDNCNFRATNVGPSAVLQLVKNWREFINHCYPHFASINHDEPWTSEHHRRESQSLITKTCTNQEENRKLQTWPETYDVESEAGRIMSGWAAAAGFFFLLDFWSTLLVPPSIISWHIKINTTQVYINFSTLYNTERFLKNQNLESSSPFTWEINNFRKL